MEIVSADLQIESESVYAGMELLLRVLAYSKNPSSIARAKAIAVQVLSAPLLGVDELTSLLDRYNNNREVTNWMWYRLGKESAKRENYAAARYWYNRVIKANLLSYLVNSASEELNSLKDSGFGIPTVLVLAPLSGDFAEFGTAAVQGVLLALDKSGLQGKVNVRLADTRADAVTALRRTRQAVAQDSVVAIIGPIMSAPAATVASWLSSTHLSIPMLTPTATDAGIARMGPNIFQINISMDNLASGIADYAMNCLNIHEFAILSPVGDYGTAMSQSFIRAVENKGGVILAEQNFEEGRPNYSTEFDLLRNTRFKQLNRKRNIARGIANLDAVNAKDRKSFMQDSVFNFPGIFIPSSNPTDAGLIAGQVAFHKLSGTLLGTSGWYGRDLLSQGKQLVENSYFSVSSSGLEESAAYKDFAKNFKKKWNDEPKSDKVSGLSYDAASIVFSMISSGSNDLVRQIISKKTFPGLYGDIQFENGANSNVRIMSVEKSQFVEKTACPATN